MKKSLKIIFISLLAALTGIALVSCKHKNKDKAGNNQENTQQNNQDQKQDGNGKEGKGGQNTPVEPTPQPQKDQKQGEKEQKDQKQQQGYDAYTKHHITKQFNKLEELVKTKEELSFEERNFLYEAINETLEEVLSGKENLEKGFESVMTLFNEILDSKNVEVEQPQGDQAAPSPEAGSQPAPAVPAEKDKKTEEAQPAPAVPAEKEVQTPPATTDSENKLQADQPSSDEVEKNMEETVSPTHPSEDPNLKGDQNPKNKPGDADALVVPPHPGTTTEDSTSHTSPSVTTPGNEESSSEDPSNKKESEETVDTPSNGASSTDSPTMPNAEESTQADGSKEEEKIQLEAPSKAEWDANTGYITYTFTTSKKTYEKLLTKKITLKITSQNYDFESDLYGTATFGEGSNAKNLNPKHTNGTHVTFEISPLYYFKKGNVPADKYTLKAIYLDGNQTENILKTPYKSVDINF